MLNSSETSTTLDAELEELIGNREVDALVALSNTEVCRRIAGLVNARVPLVYTPHFEGTGLPDWVEAIGETPERQLVPAIDWMANRYRPKRWYLLGSDYCWPHWTHLFARSAIRATGAYTEPQASETIASNIRLLALDNRVNAEAKDKDSETAAPPIPRTPA